MPQLIVLQQLTQSGDKIELQFFDFNSERIRVPACNGNRITLIMYEDTKDYCIVKESLPLPSKTSLGRGINLQ